MSHKSKTMTRRRFVAGTSAAAVSFSVIKPAILGSQTPEKIKLGLIGCGGRGTWIAKLFLEHGGYDLVAAADYFQDRVDTFGDTFSVAAGKRFTGLAAYARLIDKGGIDAIAVESPPYFHPEQAAAGISAGKHVYLAKPVAVDVPGCMAIQHSGVQAGKNNLCFLVDFQTRANDFFIEAIKRVHDGAIGKFAFGEASYHAGSPWKDQAPYLEENPTNPENQLRAWGISRALSGDIITEQNIHTLDVASWIMDQEPVAAYGVCGHKVRTDKGDCSDHFALCYQYPDDVGITFSSRQFIGHDSRPEGIRNRVFGSKGVLETEYGGRVLIRGDNFYKGGMTEGIYGQGAASNIAAFYESIKAGDYRNTTVEPSVRSNLVTILGRMAAYEKRTVTWQEMLRDTNRMEPNLKGLIT